MLRLSLTFLLVGLIAAVLGFTTIAGTAIGLAKILFFVFAALFVITFLLSIFAGGNRDAS